MLGVREINARGARNYRVSHIKLRKYIFEVPCYLDTNPIEVYRQ